MAEKIDSAAQTGVLTAFFSGEDELRGGLRQLAEQGVAVEEVYSPYPLHGIEEMLGRRPSLLPWVTLAAGVVGGLGALGFQFYTAVWDWPLNVGGKPANSTLAFIPITFELTVLLAGLASAAAFLWRSRLFPGKPSGGRLEGVTDDRFAVVVRGVGAGGIEAVRSSLVGAGAEVVEP